MLYPVAIELGDHATAFGVNIPYLPGYFSAGDMFDDVITQAKQAIAVHIELLHEMGCYIPTASNLETLAQDQEYKGYLWAKTDVDTAQYY